MLAALRMKKSRTSTSPVPQYKLDQGPDKRGLITLFFSLIKGSFMALYTDVK
jgi:hypothetical protein